MKYRIKFEHFPHMVTAEAQFLRRLKWKQIPYHIREHVRDGKEYSRERALAEINEFKRDLAEKLASEKRYKLARKKNYVESVP